jgi:hypothetical protein
MDEKMVKISFIIGKADYQLNILRRFSEDSIDDVVLEHFQQVIASGRFETTDPNNVYKIYYHLGVIDNYFIQKGIPTVMVKKEGEPVTWSTLKPPSHPNPKSLEGFIFSVLMELKDFL